MTADVASAEPALAVDSGTALLPPVLRQLFGASEFRCASAKRSSRFNAVMSPTHRPHTAFRACSLLHTP
jgi:hypothetical protein